MLTSLMQCIHNKQTNKQMSKRVEKQRKQPTPFGHFDLELHISSLSHRIFSQHSPFKRQNNSNFRD